MTGLQTMPSIAWFPLAILLFQLSEQAILFVVVLGAAPSIANGLIGGVDEVPPPLLRTAQSLGARGIALYTRVDRARRPSPPTWRASSRAGPSPGGRCSRASCSSIIANPRRIGQLLSVLPGARPNAPALYAMMIVILVIGMVVDQVFARITNGVRRRRGLADLRT